MELEANETFRVPIHAKSALLRSSLSRRECDCNELLFKADILLHDKIIKH